MGIILRLIDTSTHLEAGEGVQDRQRVTKPSFQELVSRYDKVEITLHTDLCLLPNSISHHLRTPYWVQKRTLGRTDGDGGCMPKFLQDSIGEDEQDNCSDWVPTKARDVSLVLRKRILKH
jgi:hypothetical protein